MAPIAECERRQIGPFKIGWTVGEIPVGETKKYTLPNGSRTVLFSQIPGFTDLRTGKYYLEGEELLLAGGKVAKATRERRIMITVKTNVRAIG